MIISASRRTDIPNYYSDWFFNRIKEGYALVRNPMNTHQISRIPLTPDIVDCIVFWTKNPAPMFGRLDEIKNYPYYFQFTLNSYGKDIEPDIPSKNNEIIPIFQSLSRKIGPDRVIWRYDPILLNQTYTVEYHIRYFAEIAKWLKGYTRKCTISFIDYYRKIANRIKAMNLSPFGKQDMRKIAESLSETAARYGMEIDTCSEVITLEDLGIHHAKCIDNRLIEKITGCKLDIGKDRGQRPKCGCMQSMDIGAYNSCLNGCRYCYAAYSRKSAERNYQLHDPQSPLLFGALTGNDIVKERRATSCKRCQISIL